MTSVAMLALRRASSSSFAFSSSSYVLATALGVSRRRATRPCSFSSSSSPATLVVSEPTPADASSLPPATLSAVAAARELHDGPISLLLVTRHDSATSSLERLPVGLERILVPTVRSVLAEDVTEAVRAALDRPPPCGPFSHVVASASKFGADLLPRAAVVCANTSPVTDVVEIVDADTFVRPIYAGNALAKVRTVDVSEPRFLSVRATAFDRATETDASSGNAAAPSFFEELPVPEPSSKTTWVSENLSKSDGPDLTSASVVVSGGRGLGDAASFAMLERLAAALKDGAVGATRAAVDAGYVPNDLQIGQTGKVVAPDLYVAVGISGAVQHLSGMKDSRIVVAINRDPEAPIFRVADYGLVADLFEAVPELTDKL